MGIEFKSSVKIKVNGKEYSSFHDVPEEDRKKLTEAMKRAFENQEPGTPASRFNVHFTVNGHDEDAAFDPAAVKRYLWYFILLAASILLPIAFFSGWLGR